ncbi:hypothetical protein ACFC1T_09310 [Kitasatospora sp. NPDC056076]|uniref:hypothetical protein n=1 Tax=Kitasatospora sp. NPDC056076 TaxID=3345703 RepID=UPI0035D8B7AF
MNATHHTTTAQHHHGGGAPTTTPAGGRGAVRGGRPGVRAAAVALVPLATQAFEAHVGREWRLVTLVPVVVIVVWWAAANWWAARQHRMVCVVRGLRQAPPVVVPPMPTEPPTVGMPVVRRGAQRRRGARVVVRSLAPVAPVQLPLFVEPVFAE